MDSKSKGDSNEQHVADFLKEYFRQVHRPDKEIGDDFICQYLSDSKIKSRNTDEIQFKFQAKCDYVGRRFIPIKVNTFRKNVSSLARNSFFILFTQDFEKRLHETPIRQIHTKSIPPTHFLNLYNWLLYNNFKDFLNKKGNEIHIPKSHLNPIKYLKDKGFQEELNQEVNRVNLFINDLLYSFSKRNIELSFFEFSFICKNFDLPFMTVSEIRKVFKTKSINEIDDAIETIKEELKNNDYYVSIYSKIAKDITHPLDKVEPEIFDSKRVYMTAQLDRFRRNERFSLCEDFNVIDMAVARSIATTSPYFINPCLHVLKSFLKSVNSFNYKDVCCSFLMLSSMYFAYNEKTIGDKILSSLCSTKVYKFFQNIKVKNIESYSIKHHYFMAYSEITGDSKAAIYSTEIARENRDFQITHLQDYGWPWDNGAVKLYTRGTMIKSDRGNNLKTYNKLMSDVMELINLNIKYG